jgi:intein/homing endonuclease
LEGISSVETIQDIVETALMDSGRHDVAKQYILYRNDRNKSRNKGIKYKLLDDEFISPYKHKPSTMKPIGEFVYYRTYSRWLPEHKRREYWWETVRRAVEFNCNLVPNVSKAEAQQLFDNMYNLRQFLSGRTMWVGNTEVSKEHGIANYNCSFVVIDEFCKFHELFYALMVGTGVGFRVLKTDVNKLPHARTDIRLIHEQYTPISKGNRQDNTSIEFLNNFAQIKVGDSKEGWVQALELYFKIISDKAYKGVNTIVINYDNVRPKGEKLKRFGGTASGHESLKNMFTKIHNVISNDSLSLTKKLKPIDCLDICNIIGENVVVGGVRRCLPKGSLVHTDNGLIPIEQVQIGNNVLTSKGYHRVTDWVEQGEQELLTIKTQMGEFKCTPKHKIAILNNINSYEWKMAKDLQRGDKMIFVRESIGGKNLSLPDYKHVKNNHDTNSVDIVIPKLDEEVAWFLGYLHGNGYVGKNSVSISIPNNNTIIDKVRRCFAKFGTNVINKLSKSNWIVLESKSIQLANYLSQFKKANTSINIPSFILQNMEEIRTAYLIGLYDSDGTSKNRPVVAVSSIYPMYLKQVQSLYASLSIPTRLELKRIGKGNWKDLYTITVVGENAKIDFISKVGSKSVKFVNDAKTLRSGHSYGYPNSWVTNINNKNLWSKTSKQMTVETYERITGEIQKLIPIEIEELIYTGEIAETYDISVDTANEFVCEGYLVHNTAEIGLIDADDSETIEAKASLYYQNKDGAWVENKAISHRKMSNNSIFYLEKPTREQLKWQMQQMRYSGEPGFINVKAARKRREDFEGLNPCFTGEMQLLTSEGYKTFKELSGKQVDIVNKDGNITNGKVWSSGIKEIWEVKFTTGKIIRCTGNHIFMLEDGAECEAKNLKGKRVIPYLYHNNSFDNEYVKYGFIQGDGNTGRLDSKTHNGMEVNIGHKDVELFKLFNIEQKHKEYSYYLNGYNDILRQLGFSSKSLTDREFPTTFGSWGYKQKLSFLKGCYSANGSVLKNGRITYKTTSKIFAEQLSKILQDLGINNYITLNKPKEVQFSNGKYKCKESYDINIMSWESRVSFYNLIGFIQTYKISKLKDLLIKQSPQVISVKNTKKQEEVFDFTEPATHWGVVEGFIAHNCAEILLRDRGLCNLTTVNIMSFVDNGKIDEEALLKAQRLSARAGLRMTCLELEMHQWHLTQYEDRLLGCSLTGWQDAMNAVGYDMEQQKELLKKLKEVANAEATEYAIFLNIPRPKLVCTIKPEGTISQLPTVSSGVHYSHSPYYVRRIRINANDPLVKVCEELNYPVHPEVGQELETCNTKVVEFPVKAPQGKTKYDVSALEQLEIYRTFQENYTDHNSSITVHVRNEEWEKVEEWLWNNWDDVVAVSFLSLDDSFYPLLPYEAITEEEYNERVSKMKPLIPSLISKYEAEETDLDVGNDGCEAGVCPVR